MAVVLVDSQFKKNALLQLQARQIDQIIVVDCFEEAERFCLRNNAHFIFCASAPYAIRGTLTNPSVSEFCRALNLIPNDAQMAHLTRAFKRDWMREANRFFGFHFRANPAAVAAAAAEDGDEEGENFNRVAVEARENDPVCVVCRENVASVCLSGCGHQCICPNCMKYWKARTCPMCREPYKPARCLMPIVPDSCIKRC